MDRLKAEGIIVAGDINPVYYIENKTKEDVVAAVMRDVRKLDKIDNLEGIRQAIKLLASI